MAWTTAKADLRILLSDGPTDKLRYRKRILNQLNGVNLRFKTFEFRRVTNFASEADATLGVFLGGVRLTQGVQVTADNPEVGEFVLAVAPPDSAAILECTYYSQWFLDAELDQFLRAATEWLGLGTDPDNIPPGLQPAAKYYAAQEAYHKLCSRWAELQSETFRLEDAPAGEAKTPVDYYRMLANDAKKKSEGLRDSYYSGQGAQLAPSWGTVLGRVPRVQPKR